MCALCFAFAEKENLQIRIFTVTNHSGVENGILTASKTYEVAVDEVDYMGRIKPSAWLMYMQDLATEHAEQLGLGYYSLYEQKCFWVITQVSVRVYGYVRAGSRIVLRTYPLMDAELAFYANGVKLTQTHADSDYWEYVFTMPDEDVVITHEIADGFLPD